MKFLSTALVLLSAFMAAEGAKNRHGFDAGFLKAMNQGSKKSGFLKDVTNHERKQFWKNLLKKAKPASSYPGLRAGAGSKHRKLDDQNAQQQNNNYNGGNGQDAAQGNGDYDQYANQGANGYNYNAGNNYNYNQNGEAQGEQNQYANQYNYQGQYNYGQNENVNYNYNGNANQQYYDQAYYEQMQNQEEAYGIDWANLGFDMKQYSLKYTGCSAVKTYDSNKAQNGWSDVLSSKRFALFRLCPSNNCNKYSVNGCGRNYGEYVLEMDSFLEGVVEFNRQRYWHYCHFCRRCNGLESYGERMSGLSEEQMEFYEQMQEEAEEYYQQMQENYENENAQYAYENAAYYNNYYNANAAGDDAAAAEDGGDGDGDANNGGRRLGIRKLKVPKTKRQLYNNYNQNQQYWYYQQKKQQAQEQYYDEDGNVDYDSYQEYMENMNQNMYNNFYWDQDVYGEWSDDWSESWLAFNWQVLPYCSESELQTCYNADETCDGYEEDFEEEADAMGGFSACTQIDDGYYIGPHCNSDGYTITLGVYSDEYCDTYIGDQVNLYDVLGYDIDEDFDFFPQECVTCEEGGEEKEFSAFMGANQDFDNYESWLDQRWQEYVEMAEEMYDENNGAEQNQYYQQQQAYYQAQNYAAQQQQGYYYANGRQQQNGGGAYYYGDQDQQQQYAQYGGQNYANQQMAEQYGNYGASMLNQGMNFYYNRGMAGSWITDEMYNQEEWAEEQQEEYGDYYWYQEQQRSFQASGVADVCGALYTYAAKCNKHLTSSGSDYSSESAFQYSFGSSNQEANEDTVCNFIDNLQTQKYDEFGEIILDASQNQGRVIDFAGTNWADPDQVKAQAEKAGVTVGQAVGLAITMAACIVMAVWACCLHSTLARKNIPWRPKRGKNNESTDINRQNSGIVMGRSRSGMSATGKSAPLI